MADGERKTILVSSLISHRTAGPRVDITVGDIRVQLSTMEARDLAANILQCIAAAESDAFIFHFVTEQLKQPPNVGAHIIENFRIWRDKLEKEWQAE